MKKQQDTKERFPSPFKKLKGLSVPSAPAAQQAPDSCRTAGGPVAPEPCGAELFRREMERLGVGSQNPGAEEESETQDEAGTEPAGNVVAPATDRELFLQALGELQVTFADEVPEPSSPEQASARRVKQLRQGRLVPEARLDLHGLSREQARQKLRFFLEDSRHHGLGTVLIITGQGKSSGGEAVLRADAERYLNLEGRAWVAEWSRAPRQYGGEGALVVFLRRGKPEKS